MAVPDQSIRPGGGVRGACPEDSRVCGGGAGRHHEAPPQHDVSNLRLKVRQRVHRASFGFLLVIKSSNKKNPGLNEIGLKSHI